MCFILFTCFQFHFFFSIMFVHQWNRQITQKCFFARSLDRSMSTFLLDHSTALFCSIARQHFFAWSIALFCSIALDSTFLLDRQHFFAARQRSLDSTLLLDRSTAQALFCWFLESTIPMAGPKGRSCLHGRDCSIPRLGRGSFALDRLNNLNFKYS